MGNSQDEETRLDLAARQTPSVSTIGGKVKEEHGSHKEQDADGLVAEPTSPPLPLIREIFLVFTVCCAQIMNQAGFAQALVTANIIAETFGTQDTAQSSWFSASFTLTAGTFILIAGRIGDIYGYKRVLSIGYAWLALWSLLGGLSIYSKSLVFFNFCRAMQGIGAAFCLPNGMAIIGSIYPNGRRKNIVFALFGACNPNGWIVSAAFAALITERAWWPWSFWVLAIVCLVLAAFALIFVPDPPSSSVPTVDAGDTRTKLQHLDLMGSFTGVAGLILFNLAWNQAPVVGWGEPYVIVVLILGVIFFGAFVWLEKRSKDPILPVRDISGQAIFVMAVIAFGWSSFGQALFYWLQFAQDLRHITPLTVVAQMTPITVAGFVAAMTCAILMTKTHVSYLLILSMLGFCIGNIIICTMPIHQNYWVQAFWFFVIMPWGLDVSFPAAAVLMSGLVSPSQQGIAGSLVATVINYSISIGLGIGGTAAAQIGNGNGDEDCMLAKFRAAWYTGVGLSGCGVLLAVYFSFVSQQQRK